MEGGVFLNIEIVEKEQTRIIGLKVETLLQDTKEHMIIPKLQQLFNYRLTEINGAIGLPTTYGVFIDPPNYNPDVDLFTWIAGVEVAPDAVPPVDMVCYDIPKATFAVIQYQGDIHDAGAAYGELFEWIGMSDFEQADTYGFEMYPAIYSAIEQGNAEFKLHFPIRKKQF